MEKLNCLDAASLNQLSSIILDASIAVHREMGPGLLENVYQHCMVRELTRRQIAVQKSVPIPLYYRGESLCKEYIIDILVENEIILELKSIEGILKVHEAQLITYLKLADKRLGFLINFNVPLLKQGFKRFVNKFEL
jgi:GxxExxY protein